VTASTAADTSFNNFYSQHFLPEHHHPGNRALHILGTVASVVWVPAVLIAGQPWWLLGYPLVHVLPGLLGHRLFERNAAVGDVRVLRQDFPLLWFVRANHRMTWHWLRRAR
jgi:hypothetical protein